MPEPLTSEEILLQEKKRKTTLAKIIYQISIAALIPMAMIAWVQDNHLLATADIVGLCFMLLFLWLLKRPCCSDAAILASSLFFFVFCLYLFISGGVENTAYVWYYVFPLVNAFLLGANYGALISLSLLAITFLYILSPLPALYSLADYSPNLLLRFFPSMLVVIFFAYLAEKSRIDSRRELVESAEELLREKVKSDQATKAKSIFLANMSHEIRNPMAAIIGMSEIVLKTELTDRQRRLLGVVKHSSDNLLALLNDILDFSKIEAGQISLENRKFSLNKIVEAVSSAQQSAAEGKTIKFVIENRLAEKNYHFIGDELRVKQILLNLLSNAIKFTDEGFVRFAIDEIEPATNQNQHTIKFSIIDSGIGIPPEKQEIIFQSFSQSDISTARHYGGTGLGLAICDQLAKLMGGKIELESEPDQGSSFFFEVTLTSAGQEIVTKDRNSQKENVKNLQILLVEDNPVNQEMIVTALTDVGHQVVTSNNGLEGLAALCRTEVDLILMDVQMPVMDGLEASSYIRAAEQGKLSALRIPEDLADNLNKRLSGKQLPIIALTANAMKGDKEQCQEAGMTEYLTKPINVDQIYETLNKVTSTHH